MFCSKFSRLTSRVLTHLNLTSKQTVSYCIYKPSISSTYLSKTRFFSNIQTAKYASSASKSVKSNVSTSDAELLDFLSDEIKLEKENEKKLSKIKGFEITKCDGPSVVLTKKYENEIITVKFNVNNTVEDAVIPSAEAAEQNEPEMVSRPALVIEINRGGENSLALHCIFPTPEDQLPTEQGQEAYEDLLEIQDVTIIKKSQEWNEEVYSLSGSIMDGNLYDMLLKMLEERGIDGDFVEDVIEWSTAYEHKKYVSLLEQMKNFIANK